MGGGLVVSGAPPINLVLRSVSCVGLVIKSFLRWFSMRKENPVRYSSAVGEAWLHAMFKINYCHKIFDDETANFIGKV